MGKIKDKRIIQTRAYHDPNNAPVPDWDYDYIYPKSVYDAIKKTFDEDSVTLSEEINSIYRLISEKQPIVSGGAPGSLMTWTNREGEIASTQIVKSIAKEAVNRSHTKIPSERAVGQLFDTKVDTLEYNKHVTNNNIHITEEERERWNNAASNALLGDHANNKEIHTTKEEKDKWNNKVDLTVFNEFLLNRNNPHAVTAHQVGTYSRNEIDDMIRKIRDSFFNYKNIAYNDRTNTAELTDYNERNWNPNYVLQFGQELPTVTDESLTYFALKPATDYSTNETQVANIYIKKPGVVWTNIGTANMEPGDMVIRFKDTTMYVWMQGRFVNLFNSSGGSGGSSDLMWRPVVSSDGVLTWSRSTETLAPDPVTIKGPAGKTPVKGVDYFDGANGQGVPTGGSANEILVKSSDADFDSKWKSVGDAFEEYIRAKGGIPKGLVRYEDIEGTPKAYTELGNNTDGFVVQNTVTVEIEKLKQLLLEKIGDVNNAHITNYNNPHRVTAEQIGAVTNETYLEHITNHNNPHNVTKEQVGLGNVDNTADKDKPISLLTQAELDKLNQKLKVIDENTGLMNFITKLEYNQISGRLNAIYNDGTRKGVNIITNGLVDEIEFNEEDATLIVKELSGIIKKVSLAAIHNKYTGSDGKHVNVVLENNVISATINPKSITSDELADKVITGKLIEDGSILSDHFADKSIKGNKIADDSISNTHLKNGSITVEKMLGGKDKNMILITNAPNSTPVWSKVFPALIPDGMIESRHLKDSTVNGTKIAEYTISSDHLLDKIITNRKIFDKAITGDKIQNGTITGENISPSIKFTGYPALTNLPTSESNDGTISSTQWVTNKLSSYKITDANIEPHSIAGRHLFSSRVKNRVLVVDKVDGEPFWGQVNEDMIADQGIDGVKIKDNSILSEKIKENNILASHIKDRAIQNRHITDDSVTSEKIFQSEEDNMVLAAAYNNRHPVYTKVIDKMMAKDSVTTNAIADESITPSKFARIADSNTVLATKLSDHDPEWTKISTDMIEPFSITSSRLFKSPEKNMILGVRDKDTPAYYMKINGEMIENNTINSINIKENAITNDKIPNNTITMDKLKNFVMGSSNIEADSITGKHIMKTDMPFAILGTDNSPLDGAKWTKISADYFVDRTIPAKKLRRTDTDPKKSVLGINNNDIEFLKIVDEMILDSTISSSKLNENLLLKGNPIIERRPEKDANNNQIPDTKWVNVFVDKKLENVSGEASNVSPIDKDRIRIKVAEALEDLDNLDDNSNIKNTITQIIEKYLQDHPVNIPNDLVIDTRNIKDNAVTNPKLAPDSVSRDKIVNRSIDTSKLEDDSVTERKLATQSIRAQHLSDDRMIDTKHIYDHAIKPNQIAPDAINNEKVQENSISGSKISNNTALPEKIRVNESNDVEYESSWLRNTIISGNAPRMIYLNGSLVDPGNGSIWMQYQ